MAFYAKNFVFDGIPSEMYGLVISSSSSGEDTSNASTDVDIKIQTIFRRPVPYFYGVTQTPVLEFDAEVYTTESEITQPDSALIQKWLFGQSNYKKLRIVQPDMEEIYFNCFLTKPKICRVGNIIIGYTFTVVCDSPFAWGIEKTVRYSQSNTTNILFNESDNVYYTYPTLTIQLDGTANGTFLIRNITDNNRTFSMGSVGKWLQPSDLISINNDLQIVTATITPNILNTIESPITFFRLLSGSNEIYVSGNIQYVDISYTPLKKAG